MGTPTSHAPDRPTAAPHAASAPTIQAHERQIADIAEHLEPSLLSLMMWVIMTIVSVASQNLWVTRRREERERRPDRANEGDTTGKMRRIGRAKAERRRERAGRNVRRERGRGKRERERER
eukprot:2106831-Rhodomonas_salina.1